MEKSGVVISDEDQHDGQIHSVLGDHLNLPIMKEVPHFVVDYEIPDRATFSKKTYKHITMHCHHENDKYGEKVYSFWVPLEEKYPQPYIMRKLIKRYVK